MYDTLEDKATLGIVNEFSLGTWVGDMLPAFATRAREFNEFKAIT
jgi:hypothetical protein